MQAAAIIYQMVQMAGLTEKDLNQPLKILFKEPKETMLKDVKDCMMTLAYQIQNINR